MSLKNQAIVSNFEYVNSDMTFIFVLNSFLLLTNGKKKEFNPIHFMLDANYLVNNADVHRLL